MEINELITDLTAKKKAVREQAVDKLALAQDTKAIPHLIQVLEHDKEGSVRRRAALALGRIGDETSKEALAKAMLHDKDEETRKNAAISLGNFGDERAILPLYQFLQAPRKNNFFDNLDRARINKVLIELAQKKMQGSIEQLVEWYRKKLEKQEEK